VRWFSLLCSAKPTMLADWATLVDELAFDAGSFSWENVVEETLLSVSTRLWDVVEALQSEGCS